MARDDERARRTVRVNRAPVLTLWAAVVAERLGLDRDEALTFGRALAGVTAYAKGVRLGVIEPSPERVTEERNRLRHGEAVSLRLMGRLIPAMRAPDGFRAVAKDKPIAPGSVERYLKGKFGDDLAAVRAAMEALASSMPPETLARCAFSLYEQFRPAVKPGAEGWGAEGELDPERIAELAGRR